MTNEVSAGTTQFERRRLPLKQLELPLAGVVHLWLVDLNELGSPLALSREAGARLDLGPREERTVRRFYLRLLLGAYLGISGKDVKISRIVKGKPVLDPKVHGTPLDFSSASSGGCCLIGISSQGRLGVDLELSGRKALRPGALVRRYFSEREKDCFEAMPPDFVDRAFLHTWACKEAVVKAAGLGIADQLHRFTVSTDPDEPARLLDIEDGSAEDWRLSVIRPAARLLAGVALKHDQIELRGFILGRSA